MIVQVSKKLSKKHLLSVWSLFLFGSFFLQTSACIAGQEQPNILWLTSEDNGPEIGCFGDAYADTPNIDRLAKRGMRYMKCWSNAPVCAPARTTLISGIYPPSTGSEHMRSMTSLPANFKMYPQYLREAGYYCTNKVKEDYNLQKPGVVWDQSNGRAHWKKRKKGQPFFAIFNDTISHESKLRTRPHTLIHDPAKAPIPAYHPDTPEVRHDWAQYYDRITEMDKNIGRQLDELEKAGLLESTIIFYYGDHGSGMPRSKRWTYNSGLLVPLIVVIPEKFKHLRPADYQAGGTTDQLVSFVDFAPTLLNLAGIKIPKEMQGTSFLGENIPCSEKYQFGFRGRMDERYDMTRAVSDGRYIYVRNYMPHKIQGQYLDYMFKTPTTKVWHDLFHAGKLNDAQSFFWKPKPAEELYDLKTDPDEVRNLASSKQHQETKQKLKAALKKQIFEIRDIGFLPEAEIHSRAGKTSPYEMGHDPARYDLKSIYAMAELAATRDAKAVPQLIKGLKNSDSAVRYWSMVGFLVRGKETILKHRETIQYATKDTSPVVRSLAWEALGQHGTPEEARSACEALIALSDIKHHGPYVSLLALNSLNTIDPKIRKEFATQIEKLPRRDDANITRRMQSYSQRMFKLITEEISP